MLTELHTNSRNKRGKIAAKTAAKSSSLKGTAAKINVPVVATDYMTTGEAAAYVKMSRQFLEAARYRGDGSGPGFIKLGRSVRYRKSTLDKWMSAHDHSPDEPI
jgi:helix-turn-helix protein